MNQLDQYSSSVRNATRAARAWADTPVGLLVRVEVLVTLSCGLLAMQVFLGSGRRISRSAAFRLVVLLALMLCYPAVSYTMGLIQSGSFRNDLVVVWACYLIGCADGIFACSVDHSDNQARTMLNQATQVVYVLLLLVSNIGSMDLHLQILLVLLWVLNVTKLGTRVWSMLSDGRDQVLTKDNWLVSKYMAHHHVRSFWDFDPETMRGYGYVVTGEKEKDQKEKEGGLVGAAEYEGLDATDDELVTVDRLWQQDQYDGRLKDLCLSFALFKLLRRRLSGNSLPERHDMRTQVFVRNGLAGSHGDSSSYERMYRVIEVELGFLFDFFYARYPSPKQSLIPETAMFLAGLAVSLSTLLSPALLHYRKTQSQRQVGFVTTGLDIWLARFVIVLFLVLELFQYLSLVLSDWHKVKMLCRYARWQRRRQQADNNNKKKKKKKQQQVVLVLKRLVLWVMSRATLTTGYWSNSVGQYSLLHACLQNHRSCCTSMPLHPWIKDLLNRIRTVTRPNLPVTVKRAIHLFVQSDWMSNLMCGDRTLQRINMLEVLEWSTTRYRHGGGLLGSILVWHIATTICAANKVNDASTVAAAAEGQEVCAAEKVKVAADYQEAATTLSNYCAYLLFHETELLAEADQIYEMRRLTQALQHRIQKFLKEKACRSKNDMFRSLPGFQPHYGSDLEQAGCGGYEQLILADGIKLEKQITLHMPDETLRWKFLSEMWVELLLSAAPSDNVMIHVKKLATGGELITHIWTLLTHAGVIDKPKKKSVVIPVENY